MKFKSVYNYYSAGRTHQILVDVFDEDTIETAVCWCTKVSQTLEKQNAYWLHQNFNWCEPADFENGGIMYCSESYNSKRCIEENIKIGSKYEIILRWGHDDIV